jgi:hypothetical protein
VLHDQLPLVPEQVVEGDLSGRALEHVLLVHLDHGQAPPAGVELVVPAGHLLLLGQQPPPGLEPLLAGHDIGKTHRDLRFGFGSHRNDEPARRKWTVADEIFRLGRDPDPSCGPARRRPTTLPTGA